MDDAGWRCAAGDLRGEGVVKEGPLALGAASCFFILMGGAMTEMGGETLAICSWIVAAICMCAVVIAYIDGVK